MSAPTTKAQPSPQPTPLAPSELAWLDGYETGRRDAERQQQYQQGVIRMVLNAAGGRS